MTRRLTERLRRVAIDEGGPVSPLLEGRYEGVLMADLTAAEGKDVISAAIRRLGALPLSAPGQPQALTATIGSGFLHFIDTKLVFAVEGAREGSVLRVRAEVQGGFFRQRAAVMAVERALEELKSVLKERIATERS